MIRSATSSDAEAIGLVWTQVWRESGQVKAEPDDDEKQAFEAGKTAELWRRRLDPAVPNSNSCHLAEIDGRVIGIATTGPSRDRVPVRAVELIGINVIREFHGTGIGQALLDAALGEAPASLWVGRDNARALAFYRRNGFHADGGARGQEPGEVRMIR